MSVTPLTPRAPAVAGRRPVLVTGGAGFIGSNLADRLARDGHDVLVYDALARPGVEINVAWLKARHPQKVTVVTGDIRDEDAISQAAMDAQAVFHFAAQVAVTTSLVDPRADFAVNVQGTLNLLETLRRRADPAPLLFASTNKVYGDLGDLALAETNDAYLPVDPAIRAHGVGEARPLDFHTPYGCSKGAADQYVLDYARSFGVPTAVMRMSCVYGPRQLGTEDQGWVAHFLIRALSGEPISIYGDGRQVRDVLHVDDAVAAYLSAWSRIDGVSGRAFNLGGGPGNAISLLQLVRAIEEEIGRPVDLSFSDWRAGDQRWFVADTRLAARELGLPAPIHWRKGVAGLAAWLANERGLARPAARPRTAEALS
ncbi:MAG TPA: SDR family NAD(P)-dependent oxidoreductase [Salinarimonas sp.]|nr:SDR family NAD(P)-dependent oxidoreductase [Salinarimonas sp.]